ncbi:MAG: hypothetical protein KatS3mg102_2544 [Planctomycetota bacterium]|nr:MAG: hypothetical protein KatS3mg102_2544 [Planctomycetota bacterium]
MEIRIEDRKLVAPGALPFTREQVELRRLKPGVSPEQVMAAIARDGRDDILIRAEDGQHYVASAGQLGLAWSLGFPRAGDRVRLGELAGQVVWANDERNVGHLVAAVASGAAALAPAVGIGYALLRLHTASDLIEVLAYGLGLPVNALVGAAVWGGAATLAAVGGDVVSERTGERAARGLEALTEPVASEG